MYLETTNSQKLVIIQISCCNIYSFLFFSKNVLFTQKVRVSLSYLGNFVINENHEMKIFDILRIQGNTGLNNMPVYALAVVIKMLSSDKSKNL